MGLKKIDAMHKLYGIGEGTCKNCKYLVSAGYDRTYYKCQVYGVSYSTATDWRVSNIACGLKNKSHKHDRPVIEITMRSVEEPEEQVSGQMDLFGLVK